MKITEEQELAQHAGVKGPMDRVRQKAKGERAYTNDEIARFEGVRAELRAWDDIENIERGERAVAVLRGNAK